MKQPIDHIAVMKQETILRLNVQLDGFSLLAPADKRRVAEDFMSRGMALADYWRYVNCNYGLPLYVAALRTMDQLAECETFEVTPGNWEVHLGSFCIGTVERVSRTRATATGSTSTWTYVMVARNGLDLGEAESVAAAIVALALNHKG